MLSKWNIFVAGISELMRPVDALSRGWETPELSVALRVDLSNSVALDELMVWCNPTVVLPAEGYHDVFQSIHGVLVQLEEFHE